jgi:DNA repair protein RadC
MFCLSSSESAAPTPHSLSAGSSTPESDKSGTGGPFPATCSMAQESVATLSTLAALMSPVSNMSPSDEGSDSSALACHARQPAGSSTGQAAAGRDPDSKRFHAYDRILQAAVRRDWFSAAEVREAVGLESRLVHQVLRLLSNDGLIVRLETAPAESSVSRTRDSTGPEMAPAPRCQTRKQRGPAFRWTEKRAQLALTEWVKSKVYSNRITRAPVEDRPRERLLALGAVNLRTADLIAILIRSGNARESALQAGERVAAAYAEQLEQLSDARRGDLRELSSAIGETAYCQIMAGVELGRRIAEARSKIIPRPRIQSTDEARDYCSTHFRRLATDSKHEEFHIVLLNTRYEPIGSHRVSSGTLDASLVHPREVFRPAIKEAAKAILLVHNHPSGDPTPGEQDIRVTRRLNDVAKLIGIDVLDHIVVAARGAYSLRDAGLGFD